jgi:hypothetical protein
MKQGVAFYIQKHKTKNSINFPQIPHKENILKILVPNSILYLLGKEKLKRSMII